LPFFPDGVEHITAELAFEKKVTIQEPAAA
jgi:hypothetical protein